VTRDLSNVEDVRVRDLNFEIAPAQERRTAAHFRESTGHPGLSARYLVHCHEKVAGEGFRRQAAIDVEHHPSHAVLITLRRQDEVRRGFDALSL
jgi:hypothetical protein